MEGRFTKGFSGNIGPALMCDGVRIPVSVQVDMCNQMEEQLSTLKARNEELEGWLNAAGCCTQCGTNDWGLEYGVCKCNTCGQYQ